MMILVSGATKTLREHAGHPNLGQLLTPQAGNNIMPGMAYAADNAAYSNWDLNKFFAMLDRLKGKNPLWVAAPDEVGDAITTERLFDTWYPEIKIKRGLPIALVLQNGQERIGMPADWKYDAVFIGGDDKFKLGAHVRWLVKRVKAKGKLVHMGRVNSWQRLRYAYEIGCDSVDGTGFSRFPDTYIPKMIRYLEHPQQHLFYEQEHAL